jgi:signal transduction histidine kinase
VEPSHIEAQVESFRQRGLFWSILVLRPVPLARYARLAIPTALAFAVVAGLSMGVALDDVSRQVAAAVGFTAAGLPVALSVLYLTSRLVPRSAFSSASVWKPVCAAYLPCFVGGMAGALLVLLVRGPAGFMPIGWAYSALFVFILGVLWTAIGVIVNRGVERDERIRRVLQELQGRVQELRESRRRIVQAEDKVRREVAEKLHGPLQTRLLVLSRIMRSGTGMIDTSPDEAARMLDEVRDELDVTVQSYVREISRDLHPSIVNIGLVPALRSLRDQYEGSVGCDLVVAEGVAELDNLAESRLTAEVRLALYRFAQEALGNVVKHSEASQAELRLWVDMGGKCLSLSVEDNGCGFIPEETRPGLGMITIQDYLAAHDGTYHIESAPGRGTKVSATIPVV